MSRTHWTREQVEPSLYHVLDCFGADRTFNGSDWPFAELTHPYPTWVQVLDEILADTTPGEQQKFWRTNARKVYRLDT